MRVWDTHFSGGPHPRSHRNENKLLSVNVALDPEGPFRGGFASQDPVTLATPFPLAEPIPSLGAGSGDQARALLRPSSGLCVPG